jgi:hypothetical protein
MVQTKIPPPCQFDNPTPFGTGIDMGIVTIINKQ